jgi:hypothetical protein
VQKLKFILCIFSLFSLNNSLTGDKGIGHQNSQGSKTQFTAGVGTVNRQTVRVVFWNVENLYDTYDDTTRLDNEFTPTGAMRWTYQRFHTKLNHVSKTLLKIGQWDPPAIVGLCEIENRFVMNKLIYETPLKPFGYRMIHHESPDLRGIDVALLYRPSVFRVLGSKPFRIVFPFDTSARTREILLVRGEVLGKDTITLLINHWPSRLGGYAESQPRRDYVAAVLRKILDSLLSLQPSAGILVMGDFNDEPSSESIRNILHSLPGDSAGAAGDLINLMAPLAGKEGSHRYRGIWSLLDQFMISRELLPSACVGKESRAFDTLPGERCRRSARLHLLEGSVGIFRGDFLLKDDLKYFGKKPFRTYNGLKYEGGFSDHLPVYLDLGFK